ncbi:oxygenase MpaB family protein [Catenulispora subtropica]|uniref:ER-bound oxygenase mpaB/mpaB'/Rubber oxygenase catalytic domain-containing protein n=1 Tax=Catenulispora subtropica TaxID=450798 RepID=A0ABN2TFG1_9ACTN
MTHVADMLTVGDPLADAVIAELADLGAEGRQALDQGLAEGLDSLREPPAAIRALLHQLEERPSWLLDADLADGDRATQAIPQPWDVIAFAAVSMTYVYASPSIAKLLMYTGDLASSAAPRRLAETGAWRSAVVLPGGLVRGAPGYVATARVRLMHARVRAKALRDGWDTGKLGVPINQAELART